MSKAKREMLDVLYMMFGAVMGSIITMEVLWIKLHGMGFIGQLCLAKLGLF